MAPQRPSSPTALLWTHQLKREHGFLLDRIRKIEGEFEKANQANSIAHLKNAIQAVTEQVKLIQNNEAHSGREGVIVKDVESVQRQMEAISKQVDDLRKDLDAIIYDQKRASSNERILTERIAILEENARRQETSLSEQWKRRYEEQALRIGKFDRQLEDLIKHRDQEHTILAAKILLLGDKICELQTQHKPGAEPLAEEIHPGEGYPTRSSVRCSRLIENVSSEDASQSHGPATSGAKQVEQANPPIIASKADGATMKNGLDQLNNDQNESAKDRSYETLPQQRLSPGTPSSLLTNLSKRVRIDSTVAERVTRSQAIKKATVIVGDGKEHERNENSETVTPKDENRQARPPTDSNEYLQHSHNMNKNLKRLSTPSVRQRKSRVIKQVHDIASIKSRRGL